MGTKLTIRRFAKCLALTCGAAILATTVQAAQPLQPVPDELRPQPAKPDQTIIEVEPVSIDDGRGLVATKLPTCESWSPVWSVETGVVVLRRDAGPSFNFSDGDPGINLGGMSFPYEAGPMINVTRHGVRGSDFDLQLQYYGVNSFDATSVGVGATALQTVPVLPVLSPTVATTLRSRLDSTELNLRENTCSWINAFVGFRWIELGETLSTEFDGSSHSVNVNNHLYGMQVGVDGTIATMGRISIEGFAKLGVYYNDADQTTTVINVDNTVPFIAASGPQMATATEIGLIGVVTLSESWSVRGGYQILWLDGVALPGDQLPATDLFNGVADLQTGNTALFHGFVAGIQYAW